jgi:hypothetical protein
MRMNRSKASLLLFTLTGCFHSSPDAAVLAPLVALFTQEPFDQSHQPEYLVFADELTASVFKSLRRDNRYRILPTGKPFVCPSVGAQCPQPHELNVHVMEMMGDSAVATIDRTYYRRQTLIRTGENILLVRRNGEWKIERVLNGFESVPM